MEVIGSNGKPLDLRKLRAEFDTGADECVMTQSCYLQLKELLKFKTGELDIEGVTEGEIRMTQYVELNLKIGSINFPPGIKFWVDENCPRMQASMSSSVDRSLPITMSSTSILSYSGRLRRMAILI